MKVKLNDYRMKITIVVYDEDTFIMQHDHTVLADDTVRLIFRDLDKQYEVKRWKNIKQKDMFLKQFGKNKR